MLDILQPIYPDLPVAERNVADFIAHNPHKALFMTVKEIALTVGVSEGTVVRMAQRCGFRGFSDFKIQLAVEYENEKSIYQSVGAESEFHTAIQNVFETHIRTLESTFKELPIHSMEKVVDAILNARKTEFYGVGASGYVAMDAAHKLNRMNIPSWGYNDPHTQLAMATLMSADCVAVGISHSGMTKDTIEALQIAKQNGAVTVAITSQVQSPISRVSDYVLRTAVKEPVLRSGSLAARVAQLAVVDAITIGIHLYKKDQINRMFDQTSSAVLDRKTTGGEA